MSSPTSDWYDRHSDDSDSDNDSSSPSSSAAADANAAAPSRSELLALQQRIDLLQSALSGRAAQIQSLHADAASERAEKRALQSVLIEKEGQIDSLARDLSSVRRECDSLRADRSSSAELIDSLQVALRECEKRIGDLATSLAAKEQDSQSSRALAVEKGDLEGEVARLQSSLLHTQTESNRQCQSLLNQLYTTRSYLEQLKSEYEAFSAAAMAEAAAYREGRSEEVSRLRERLEQTRVENYEAVSNMQQEHVGVIEAVVSSFSEYRKTVEEVFAAERERMEAALVQQRSDTEAEVRALLQQHQRQLRSIVAAKDAKILALIDGTDAARMLMQHAAEVEQLRAETRKEVERARVAASEEAKKALAGIRKELVDKQAEAEKYQALIVGWERKLASTVAAVGKVKKLHVLRCEQYESSLSSASSDAKKMQAQIEVLLAVREQLRHRLLRLRLQMNGSADDSLPAVLKRLTNETRRLKTDLEIVGWNYTAKSEQLEATVKERQRERERAERAEERAERREREYAALVQAYERTLRARLKNVLPSDLATTLKAAAATTATAAAAADAMQHALSKPLERTMVALRLGLGGEERRDEEGKAEAADARLRNNAAAATAALTAVKNAVAAAAGPQASDTVLTSRPSAPPPTMLLSPSAARLDPSSSFSSSSSSSCTSPLLLSPTAEALARTRRRSFAIDVSGKLAEPPSSLQLQPSATAASTSAAPSAPTSTTATTALQSPAAAIATAVPSVFPPSPSAATAPATRRSPSSRASMTLSRPPSTLALTAALAAAAGATATAAAATSATSSASATASSTARSSLDLSLPAAGDFSSRASPSSLVDNPSTLPATTNMHQRHVSIAVFASASPQQQSRASSDMSAAPTAATAPAEADAEVVALRAALAEQLQSLQSQQSELAAALQSLQPPSRTQRLQQLLKRTHAGSVSTRELLSKSGSTRNIDTYSAGESDALSSSSSAHTLPPQQQQQQQQMRGRKTRYGRDAVVPFERPAALVKMEAAAAASIARADAKEGADPAAAKHSQSHPHSQSASQLVSLASIVALERGFEQLQRFKATSRGYRNGAVQQQSGKGKADHQQLSAAENTASKARLHISTTTALLPQQQHSSSDFVSSLIESDADVDERVTRLYGDSDSNAFESAFGQGGMGQLLRRRDAAERDETSVAVEEEDVSQRAKASNAAADEAKLYTPADAATAAMKVSGIPWWSSLHSVAAAPATAARANAPAVTAVDSYASSHLRLH